MTLRNATREEQKWPSLLWPTRLEEVRPASPRRTMLAGGKTSGGPSSIRFDVVRSEYLDDEVHLAARRRVAENGGRANSNHLGLDKIVGRRNGQECGTATPTSWARPTIKSPRSNSNIRSSAGYVVDSYDEYDLEVRPAHRQLAKNCFTAWRSQAQMKKSSLVEDELQLSLWKKDAMILDLQEELSRQRMRVQELENETDQLKKRVTHKEKECESLVRDKEVSVENETEQLRKHIAHKVKECELHLVDKEKECELRIQEMEASMEQLDGQLSKAGRKHVNALKEHEQQLAELAREAAEAIRTRATAAALALWGGKAKPLVQASFVAWVRICEHGALSRRLAEHTEGHSKRQEEQERTWRAHLQELADKHAIAQDAHQQKLAELAREATEAIRTRAIAAALALWGGKAKPLVQASFVAWVRICEHGALSRSLAAHTEGHSKRQEEQERTWRGHLKELADKHALAQEAHQQKLAELATEAAEAIRTRATVAALGLWGGKAKPLVQASFLAWVRICEHGALSLRLAEHTEGHNKQLDEQERTWRAHLQELADKHALAQDEALEKHSAVDQEWSARLKKAEGHHAQAVADHGLHISGLEAEHGVMLRSADETQRRLEEEWGLKLRKATDARDLSLREAEEKQIALVKKCASTAILALISGKSGAVAAVCFHGWLRAVEKAALERQFENELRSAEMEHSVLEEQWSMRLHETDAKREEAERAWDSRLSKAEEERQRCLQEVAEEQRAIVREHANKSAFQFIGNSSERFLIATLMGWCRTARRLAYERDLDARLAAAEQHKAELTLAHDQQMQQMSDDRSQLEQEHQRQLRELAEEEGQKLRGLELQHDELQDSLDRKIQQHEDEKIQIIKDHDDDREKLLKESKALALMHRSSMGGAINSVASKHQKLLILMQCFLAWAQLCKHMHWNRAVDQFSSEGRNHTRQVAGRWEQAAHRLAGRHAAWVHRAEVFCAWLQLLAGVARSLPAEPAVTPTNLNIIQPGSRQVQIKVRAGCAAAASRSDSNYGSLQSPRTGFFRVGSTTPISTPRRGLP